MAFLELQNISKSFGGRKVLDNISLSCEKSAFISLLGLSGCGKTTLLRIIAGLENADSGKIFLDGKDITNLSGGQRNIGFVHQNFALFPHMTVFENVAYGLKIKKDGDIKDKVRRVLEKVKLSEKENQNVSTLSGGEQQRVALARTIVTEPQLILLDEPLSNLDQSLRTNARTEIKRLQHEMGITSVYVTHDQSEALALSDLVAVMDKGRILQYDSPRQVYFAPADHFVAGFVGRYNFFNTEEANNIFAFQLEKGKTLALLPENIELKPGGTFIVSDVAFNGILTEYSIETGTQTINAVVTSDTHSFTVGDRVALTANPGYFVILTT